MYCPLVSIVIPAYNAANYLEEAINSALNQTYNNIEIIVVNDGSNDNGATADIAKRFEGKIIYIEKKNGGSSSALNTGIKAMKGEWFSWLSHDDLYMPEKIEKQISFINSLSLSANTLHKNIFFGGSMLIDSIGRIIRKPQNSYMQKLHNKIENIGGNEYLVAEPTKYCFHGCTCLIHREVFNEIGLFDESLRLLNDVDFWFRLYSNGYILHYLPEILVKGRIHEKQVSRTISFSYHNPEQDMYWKRSLDWLINHHPCNYELFFLFGRNAYKKTRTKDGDKAFEVAKKLSPEKSLTLTCRRWTYVLYSRIRALGKKLYLICKR